MQLMELIRIATKDENIGYYKKPRKPGTANILINHMSTAETIEEALTHARDFHGLFDNGFRIETHKTDRYLSYRMILDDDIPADSWLYEEHFTAMHRIIRWLANCRIMINHVNMPFAEPEHHEEYKLLFGAPSLFDQPYGELVFLNQTLIAAPSRSSVEIKRLASLVPSRVLSLNIDIKSYADKVKEEIRSSLPEQLPYQQIADNLLIHPQTLRRRLNEEGHEFRQIKNDLLRDLAIAYLSEGELGNQQISYLLGFKETSSFYRSFKKWLGVTPQIFQQELLEKTEQTT